MTWALMTDEDIKRLRDEAVKETVEELMDGGHDDLANFITALWCDVDRLTSERDEARVACREWANVSQANYQRAKAAEARAERAEKVVEAVRRQMAAGGATTLSQRVKVALSAYDATNTHAKPADAPQADIVGGEASEGGRGEKKTFARGEPLTWNVMGDGR